MRFSETDLIVSQGKIYHLDINPEHLAEVILTVGDPDRVALISRHFQKIEHTQSNRGFVFHTGYYKNRHISVLSTGMGTHNIDIVMTELDAIANIDLNKRKVKENLSRLKIIRLGTTGALQEHIALDTIIVSEQAIDLTAMMLFYNQSMTQEQKNFLSALTQHMEGYLPKIPLTVFPADSDLVQLFHQNSPCIKGITITCPGFYAAQDRDLRAAKAYPDFLPRLASFNYKNQMISNLEMETSAIYGLGQLLGHQCCSLNVVVLNRMTNECKKDVLKSQEYLIEVALDALLGLA